MQVVKQTVQQTVKQVVKQVMRKSTCQTMMLPSAAPAVTSLQLSCDKHMPTMGPGWAMRPRVLPGSPLRGQAMRPTTCSAVQYAT